MTALINPTSFWKSTGFLLLAALGLAIVLLAFQELPGLAASSHAILGDTGYAQCLSNGWRNGTAGCSANLGQPFGGVYPFGLPTAALAAAAFGWDGKVTFDEMQLVPALFTTIAFCGAIGFFRRLSGSAWIGLFGAVLYLLAPVVSQQGGYGALRTGFALLPAYLLLDGMLLETQGKRRRVVAAIVAAVVLVRIFAVLCDGYSFVMSSGLALCLFGLSALITRRVAGAGFAILVYLVACAIAYACYFVFVPGGAAGLGTMPIDFFRGQGVDVYTLLVPSPLFWAYQAAGLAFDFPAAAAYGDGSNIAYNFAGYTLLLAAAVMLARRVFGGRRLGLLLASLGLSALVACVLSFGPSLKFKSLDLERAQGSMQFSSYLMPPEKAVLSLGTDRLYLAVPGVRNIRVLARWQGVVHFALVGFLVALLALLARHKRNGLAIALALAALLESSPNLADAYHDGVSARAEAEAIRDQYLRELMRMTSPHERALLVQLHAGAETNHYLAEYFCPKADLRCFNIGGDKALEIVRDTWPREIEELLVGRNVGFNVRRLLATRQADVVLVSLFDLRRLAYSRQAARVDEADVRRKVDAITAGGGLVREDGTYFISLRPSQGLLDASRCGLDCWQQWPLVDNAGIVTGWGPQSGIQGEGFNRQINGHSAFWVTVSNDPDRYILAIGGSLLPTASGKGVVTAMLPMRFEKALTAPNRYNVELLDIQASTRIRLGSLEVVQSPSGQ